MQENSHRGKPKPVQVGRLARQIFELVCEFRRDGRDATTKRLAAHLLRREDVPGLPPLDPLKEEKAARAEAEALHRLACEEQAFALREIVRIGLRELHQHGVIKQRIDAWVPTGVQLGST